MPIIGKLLKKTTEFSARRNAWKGLDFKDQIKVLSKILKFAQETKFGYHYDFQSILDSENMAVRTCSAR